MRGIIVEDSRLARVELKELLSHYDNIDIVDEADGFDSAVKAINKHKPDVLFLDIQLPGKDGFAVLESIEYLPRVIFTTAYDEYAIKSFEYNALDYLLKPIRAERLNKAMQKLEKTDNHSEHVTPLEGDSRIFIRDGEQCWLIDLADIELFESNGNYTRVYFQRVKPLIYKSLNKIENRLNANQFFRVNRQYIVNLKFIKNIDLWVNGNYRLTLHNGMEIDVSRSQSARLKSMLSL